MGCRIDVIDQGQNILKKAGFDRSSQTSSHYLFDETIDGVFLVLISAVRPVNRAEAVKPLREDTSQRTAKMFASQSFVLPVEVSRLAEINGDYIYLLRDGYHRFNLSLAAGFTQIPAILINPPDWSFLNLAMSAK